MKLAILYATRYGSTRRAAEAIAAGCRDAGYDASDVSVEEITRSTRAPDADTVVIGAPVYGGRIPNQVTRFLDSHLEELMAKRVGLFLSSLYAGTRAETQLAENFPSRLITHSFGCYYVGGRVDFDSLRWWDRLMMKRVAGVERSVETTNDEEISRIVADVLRTRTV